MCFSISYQAVYFVKAAGCWVRGIRPFRLSWLTNEALYANCHTQQWLLAAGFEKREAVNYFLMMGGGEGWELSWDCIFLEARGAAELSLWLFSCWQKESRAQSAGRDWCLSHFPFIVSPTWLNSQILERCPSSPLSTVLPFPLPDLSKTLRVIKMLEVLRESREGAPDQKKSISSIGLLLEELKKKL